ncbi:unnamed protein product [Closterium sp. Yama58-4]|nr:unnamed protein product [Closterium sp. Yama58-4]
MARTEGNGHCAALPANDHRDHEVAKIAARGNISSPAFAPETPSRSQAVRTGKSSPRISGPEVQGPHPLRSHALSEGPARDFSASDSFGAAVEVAARDQRARIGGAERMAEGGAEAGAEMGAEWGAERRAEGEAKGPTEGEAEVRAAEGGGSTSSRSRQVLIRVKRKRGEASSDVIVVEAAPRGGRTKVARSHVEALRALSLGGGGGGGNERDAPEAREGRGSAVEEAKAVEGRREDASASTAPRASPLLSSPALPPFSQPQPPPPSAYHTSPSPSVPSCLPLLFSPPVSDPLPAPSPPAPFSPFLPPPRSPTPAPPYPLPFPASDPALMQRPRAGAGRRGGGWCSGGWGPCQQVRAAEEEAARKAKRREQALREREEREGQLACNYLPLLREFLPEAAREMEEKMLQPQRGIAADAATAQSGPQESIMPQQQSEQEQQDTDSDDVCDLYCMEGCLSDDDDDMDGPLGSYLRHHSAPYPTLRICDNHVFDESGEPFALNNGEVLLSEPDSDDSNAENNPLNDYGDEEEEEADDDDEDEGMCGAADADGDDDYDYDEYEEYERYAGRDENDDDDDDF